jgi:hypothetical protein
MSLGTRHENPLYVTEYHQKVELHSLLLGVLIELAGVRTYLYIASEILKRAAGRKVAQVQAADGDSLEPAAPTPELLTVEPMRLVSMRTASVVAIKKARVMISHMLRNRLITECVCTELRLRLDNALNELKNASVHLRTKRKVLHSKAGLALEKVKGHVKFVGGTLALMAVQLEECFLDLEMHERRRRKRRRVRQSGNEPDLSAGAAPLTDAPS